MKYFVAGIAFQSIFTFVGYTLWVLHNSNVWLASFIAAAFVNVLLLLIAKSLNEQADRVTTLDIKHKQLINRLEQDEQKLNELEDPYDFDDPSWG